MTKRREPIREIDLLAYADGLLDSDMNRKQEVELYLADHPSAADYVAEVQAQNDAIRAHFGDFYPGPVPEKLQATLESDPTPARARFMLQAAAVAVLVIASTAGGWLAGQNSHSEEWEVDEFVERAATFHHASPAMMTSPVASTGSGLQPLGWLNQRISLELAAPDLAAEGFSLVAKDRLGPEGDPMVRLVYKRADETTINLFLRPRWENTGGQLARNERENVTVQYWLDGPLAFAMTTDATNPETDHLARIVREAVGKARLKGDAPAMALTPGSSAPVMNGATNDRSLMPGPRAAPRESETRQLGIN